MCTLVWYTVFEAFLLALDTWVIYMLYIMLVSFDVSYFCDIDTMSKTPKNHKVSSISVGKKLIDIEGTILPVILPRFVDVTWTVIEWEAPKVGILYKKCHPRPRSMTGASGSWRQVRMTSQTLLFLEGCQHVIIMIINMIKLVFNLPNLILLLSNEKRFFSFFDVKPIFCWKFCIHWWTTFFKNLDMSHISTPHQLWRNISFACLLWLVEGAEPD